MFTRKHYRAIAEMILIRFNVADLGQTSIDRAIRLFIRDLEDYFTYDNPNFNREQFRKACGF